MIILVLDIKILDDKEIRDKRIKWNRRLIEL